MWWILAAVVVLVVIGVVVGVMTAPKASEMAAAEAELQQRTGLVDMKSPEGEVRVANRPLGTLRYEHHTRVQGPEVVATGFWRLEPSQPLRARLQLVERRLAPQSVGGQVTKAVADAVMRSSRTVSIVYPGPVPIGVQALDERFVAFTDDPSLLAKLGDADLSARLLGCAELDLRVDAQGVTLNDPSRFNLGSWMAPSSETNAAEVLRATIVAHERAIALVEHVATRLGADAAYR